ncbi:hypothetical protein QLX08_002562 [Tetragonisca angustula]|uniref:Protein hunchback n=1 Tax=Tetragonisca angustula TaxID=166442 RepID=A0AAW1AA78_9HYME
MTGNWQGPSTSVQRQEQDIVKNQESHHLPTTPAWASVDKTREESTEDKNNDSGISPDHYTNNSTSPTSRASSSTANCSLSPESAISQDWSNMQNSTHFEYNSQNGDLSGEYGKSHSVNEHQPEQEMNDVSNTMKQSSEDSNPSQELLQCPVCPFTSLNRVTLAEHLTTHYAAKFEVADFVKSVFNHLTVQDENRTSPNQGERSEQELEETDEPGLRVPRLNSQGKVKTFRCKQCNFVAITKLEFWDHSRSHIKAEKLLTCPKCPFVTEYKHHLEYHLRNHFGSKPFKCDKCSYSCVNKSMLNSHLKSHSNVYQYRCANCSYATKYCHSLKLHLRKYLHDPAMVLNVDGSPNPLPIIDVYGTRRGPKPKSQTKSQEEATQPNNSTDNNSAQATSSQFSPEVASPTTVNPYLQPNYPTNSMDVVSNDAAPVNSLSGLVQNQTVMAFSYNQLLPNLPLKPFTNSETDSNVDRQLEHMRTNVLMGYLYNKTMDEQGIPKNAPQNLMVRYPDVNAPSTSGVTMEVADVTGAKQVAPAFLRTTSSSEKMDVKVEPLDLSKSSVKQKIGTSRRKGKAVKLDRRVLEEDTDDEQMMQDEPQQYGEQQQSSAQSSTVNGKCSFGNDHEFTCQYCDIIFGNVVMYTVHMGYHGYNEPFTCNMCGHQSVDKVSFFLHIARSKHS